MWTRGTQADGGVKVSRATEQNTCPYLGLGGTWDKGQRNKLVENRFTVGSLVWARMEGGGSQGG